MNQYLNILKAYLSENPVPVGNCNMDSLLGMLYCCHHQCNNIETDEMKLCFNRLDSIMEKLSKEENDQVFNLTSSLCEQYQQAAFRQGLLVGFHLFQELTQ